MPADVSFDNVRVNTASVTARPLLGANRLPLGLGLAMAACASGGLWVAAVAGIRALFF